MITGFVRIGANNQVGYGAVIGSFPQDLSFNPSLSSGVKIGDNNLIREYCTIHRGTKEGSKRSIPNPLHIFEEDLLAAAVIKFRGAAVGVASNSLRGFKSAVIFQKIRDAGRPERVRRIVR